MSYGWPTVSMAMLWLDIGLASAMRWMGLTSNRSLQGSRARNVDLLGGMRSPDISNQQGSGEEWWNFQYLDTAPKKSYTTKLWMSHCLNSARTNKL